MHIKTILNSVLLGASAFLLADAAPLDSAAERISNIRARQSTTTAITGVPNNGVQVRMELRIMHNDHPDMFNIYMLGLQDMMAVTQSDPLSYYQIAGIHGRPYVPWDGSGSAPGYGGGYCTHTSNLFLPWHRPYLALYEQTLYKHIQTAVSKFPAGSAARAKYAAAAANFRMPYWDWAAAPPEGGKPYPSLVSTMYITVTTPSGVQTIVNPLFRYDFHPTSASDMVYNPFATWTNTKRYPTDWSSSAYSQNNLVAPQIVNNQVSFRDRLYNLFTSYSNFTQFGNEAWITSSSTNADSLESLHDAIHSIVGSNGDMTYLDYSAFDPIFWLHHTMIDRCFAMWQQLYPNSYVEPMAAVGATFTYPAGTVENVNSNLPPFHADTNGTPYTSNSVRNIAHFGYTYPELQSGSLSDLKTAINSLYGNTAASSTISKKGKGKGKRSTNDDVVDATTIQAAASDDGDSYQYITNIVSQKFAMNGSYAIYVFLGNFSDFTTEWPLDENLVGTHAVFANLGTATSMKMLKARQMAEDLKVTGAVPLTTSLIGKVAAGELASLRPADVEAYLTANLHWRVATFAGTEIAVEDVPDLSVSVVTAEVQPAPSHEEFPTWGQFTALVNVTASRPGGHDRAYWSTPENGTAHISNGPRWHNATRPIWHHNSTETY